MIRNSCCMEERLANMATGDWIIILGSTINHIELVQEA